MKLLLKSLVIPMVIILVLLVSCANSSNAGYGSYSVMTDSAAADVKKMIFLVSLKVADGGVHDGKYIVASQVRELELKLNDDLWGTIDSTETDITDSTEDTYKDFYLRSAKYEYLMIGRYPGFDKTSDITAYDYSVYLNGALSLGDYISEISSIAVDSISGVPLTIRPHIFDYVKIEPGVENLYLGSYEIEVSSLD